MNPKLPPVPNLEMGCSLPSLVSRRVWMRKFFESETNTSPDSSWIAIPVGARKKPMAEERPSLPR